MPDDRKPKRRRVVTVADAKPVKRTNAPVREPRDPTGKWAERVLDMAGRLGYQPGLLWRRFDEFACIIEIEQGLSRPISEHGGWRLLVGLYERQGVDPD